MLYAVLVYVPYACPMRMGLGTGTGMSVSISVQSYSGVVLYLQSCVPARGHPTTSNTLQPGSSHGQGDPGGVQTDSSGSM